MGFSVIDSGATFSVDPGWVGGLKGLEKEGMEGSNGMVGRHSRVWGEARSRGGSGLSDV